VSLQQIVLGSSPEGVGGDSVREAFTKVNETFASANSQLRRFI